MGLTQSFSLTELKAYIRKLDHETSDLKFLNNQYVHKVRSLEKETMVKTERIQQLQEKNMQAVVQTPGVPASPHNTSSQIQPFTDAFQPH